MCVLARARAATLKCLKEFHFLEKEYGAEGAGIYFIINGLTKVLCCFAISVFKVEFFSNCEKVRKQSLEAPFFSRTVHV